MDLRRLLGQNVRLFRTRLGISQEELAFRSGLHRTYVSGVERGIRNPTVMIIARLAKALGVDVPNPNQTQEQGMR
jgi:transcriptional regulator with XRE-family HTH domain